VLASPILNAPRIDKKGEKWHFRLWHDAITVRRTVSVALL